jgi:hypothetical protein
MYLMERYAEDAKQTPTSAQVMPIMRAVSSSSPSAGVAGVRTRVIASGPAGVWLLSHPWPKMKGGRAISTTPNSETKPEMASRTLKLSPMKRNAMSAVTIGVRKAMVAASLTVRPRSACKC